MRWIATAAVATAAVMVARTAMTQQQANVANVDVTTTRLGNNTYMLQGRGGNVTVAVGKDAVVIVDTQITAMDDKLKAAIRAISPLPIKYLINTHYHAEHSGGNADFQKDGATIVAQENTRARLATEIARRPLENLDALPTLTYKDEKTVAVGDRTLLLTHAPSAHSDGDTWVYLPDANVMATGDTFTNTGKYPTIDYNSGGSVDGMIRAVDSFIGLSDDSTKIVPGHGEVATKQNLEQFRGMMITARDRMKRLINEQKTEGEIITSKPFADLDQTWASDEQGSVRFMKTVHSAMLRQQGIPTVAYVPPGNINLGIFPVTTIVPPGSGPSSLSAGAPIVIEQAMRSCQERIRDSLIMRAARQPASPDMLRIQVLTAGDELYTINLSGLSIFLSNQSGDYWEEISIQAFVFRDFSDGTKIRMHFSIVSSRKNKSGSDPRPNPQLWADMAPGDESRLIPFQDFLMDKIHSCLVGR
jgi:cyclase